MLEQFGHIAIGEIAKYILKQVISSGLQKLFETIRNSTSPESIQLKLEIQDSEITAKIQETLENLDGIFDENTINNFKNIINGNNALEEVLPQVLSIVKSSITKLYSEAENYADQIITLPEEGDDEDSRIRMIEKLYGLAETFMEELLISQTEQGTQTQKPEPSTKLPDNNHSKTPVSSTLEEPSKAPIKEATNTNNQNSNPLPSEKNVQSSSERGIPTTTIKEMKQPSENIKNAVILNKLHKYKEYSESILRGLESLRPYQSSANEILENQRLKECLKSLKEAASKTVELASSPVKIAVMGEFSSGKTLLIGSLIGYADALPISEIPTTGNITAIHLHQQEDFKTTEFDNFSIEYLSHQEVQKCLEFMFDQAKQRTPALELPTLPQVTSTTLNQDTLNSYEEWCKSAWNQTQNIELYYLLRELLIFVRTYAQYGADLCGENLKITRLNASEGLKLTSISPVNQNLKFEDIPSVAKVSVNKSQPSSELLQNSFSLIRRVNIHIKISKEIWNLGTTQETAKFILLDFPGLGAAESGVRDTFVSLQELEEVQTILILLNGRTPGSDLAPIKSSG
jgi:hypothetical protein